MVRGVERRKKGEREGGRGVWASGREDRGGPRVDVCADSAHAVYPYRRLRARARAHPCATDRIGIRIGSTNGRKLVTAGLPDLPAERPPSAPLDFDGLSPLSPARSLYQLPLLLSSSRCTRALCLSRQLANIPTSRTVSELLGHPFPLARLNPHHFSR